MKLARALCERHRVRVEVASNVMRVHHVREDLRFERRVFERARHLERSFELADRGFHFSAHAMNRRMREERATFDRTRARGTCVRERLRELLFRHCERASFRSATPTATRTARRTFLRRRLLARAHAAKSRTPPPRVRRVAIPMRAPHASRASNLSARRSRGTALESNCRCRTHLLRRRNILRSAARPRRRDPCREDARPRSRECSRTF